MSPRNLVTMISAAGGKACGSWRPSVDRLRSPLMVPALVIMSLYVALLSSLGLIGDPDSERYLMASSYGMILLAICIAWSCVLKPSHD